ncbi:unnamed protein product [Medioppia subpectinata]|uniref:UDP-glycosyltransferase n=1 Tax=Medioppia subpectinata TaxID=1979941 RepID=A0A7R9PV18_9ACAR|nr:unnamed protein product [Medioppia subpectinata]CAG2102347.1 unnamed protein product [Medioppia subpectinata]
MANKKPLKVLFAPILFEGHVNPCIGIAMQLIADGHRAVFTANDVWRPKLAAYGIETVELANSSATDGRAIDTARSSQSMVSFGLIGGASAIEKVRLEVNAIEFWTKSVQYFDTQLARLLPAIRPDVIVLDQLVTLPAAELSGIPCVWLWSAGPLVMLDDERTPPGKSGLSATGDPRLWREFRQLVRDVRREKWRTFNDWVVGRGCEPLPEYCFHNSARYLHIYGYPLELDYQDIRPLDRNYVRFDNFKRNERHMIFAVPPELAAKPGKLVYFSLGSLCPVDVQNMRRLVAILAKSPHRFIVSMGPKHMEYTLADNMWGAASVPQIRVLPLVDLVITHGGLNTVTESLYFGRPMIAMPVFSEQYDNAQRLHDKGFGLRLDAYKCSEEELLAAIETLLNDRQLAERLAEVSRRIQTDNSLAKVSQLIENFVQNPHKYID